MYRFFEIDSKLVRNLQISSSDAELDVGLVSTVEVTSTRYEKSAFICDAAHGCLVTASVGGVDTLDSCETVALEVLAQL